MKKYLFSVLFLLMLCKMGYCSISVNAFLTGDDVTIAHLETMRSTFQGAINSADGGLLQTGTVTAAKLDANANPENRWNEAFNDFVYTGLLPPTTVGTLTSTTTAGTAYIYGTRVVKDATDHLYTASKHTYVDLSKTGTYTYSEVAINATAPAVASNSIRLAKVSTDTSKVLSVTDMRTTEISLTSIGTNYIIGTFNRDMTAASGDVSYTGVGFRPQAIIFFGGVNNSGIATYNGFDDATHHYCLMNYLTSAAGKSTSSSSYSIYLYETDGDKAQTAYVTTFDTDGFTLAWTKSGSPSAGTAVMFYMALK